MTNDLRTSASDPALRPAFALVRGALTRAGYAEELLAITGPAGLDGWMGRMRGALPRLGSDAVRCAVRLFLLRDVLTSEEIDRVTHGSADAGWDDHERALLSAAEELCDGGMIADATWDVLAARYDERQLIELPILVGQFTTVSFAQNALRARMRENNPGLTGR